ncbi:polysaccharide pyruvyl transferase CsaB [Peptoniphilus catoniae]|uniref:polysaccharide pyruvyl transferase CsaB n=1 Tax=Peptoniphilus catoniae TaxID=1660341 RepID=UPI0010FE0BF2|nr:polysaccharide pyruvyl transferase CsaB [Peptoniphilus catoniae]
MTKRILVSGYYGYNNIGDEAILKGLVDGISSKTDAQLVILSKNPDWTTAKYKVKSVNRSKLSTIIKEVKKADMVLLGGGSLLQDVTSKKSIIYYLGILMLGILFKKKTFIYSQGIGPIRLKRNRYLTKKILSKVDFINVRDNQSHRELKELGINREVLVTTDTVFGINKVGKDCGREILEKLSVDPKKKNICFTIMNWKNYGDQTVDKVSKLIELIFKERTDVNIILVPFFYHLDLAIERKIYNRLKPVFEDLYILEDYLHVKEYLSLISNMDLMLSMRLHGLIFATLTGAYPIGISYDPKIDGFIKELDRVQRYYVEDFDENMLAEEILNSLDNLESLKEETAAHLDKFYKLTNIHNEAVARVINS